MRLEGSDVGPVEYEIRTWVDGGTGTRFASLYYVNAETDGTEIWLSQRHGPLAVGRARMFAVAAGYGLPPVRHLEHV